MPPKRSKAIAPSTQPPRPRLQLLGGFELRNAAGELQALPYDKARALLAMLALQTGPLQREALAETLWPDSPLPQARANLRRALFDLRRCLDGLWLHAPTLEPLPADKKQVQLREALELSLDCQDFAQAQLDAATPQREARRQALQQCLALYRGPLLAGLNLSEAPGFEQWLAPRREALQRQALRCLEALAQLQEEDGDSAAALASARQHLALDPWCEAALRRCMRLAGPTQTGEALALFERFRTQLHTELKAQPQEETMALAQRLRQAQAGPDAEPVSARPERRRVVALACEWDLDEAAQASELRVEQMARQLQLQLKQARQLLIAQGAHVQRAEGGELLAFFGHPQALEQAPRLALSAALGLLRLPHDAGLMLRLGLHVGWVHAAPEQASPDGVGAISRQARKLALLAQAGQALVSAELRQQSERHHRFEPAAADGSAALQGLGPGGRAELLRQLLPMVGREAELAALLQQWTEAERQDRAVWLQGEPGLGKTRLLQALRQALQQRAAQASPRVLQLQCRPETLHSPLQPVVALLRRSLPPDCSDEAQLEQGVQALLQQAGLDSPSHRVLLCRLLQLQSALKPPVIEPLHKRQLLVLLSDLFERLARGQRQLLILEDLHWADPSTLELLGLHLGRGQAKASAEARPSLLLLSSRLPPPEDLRPRLSLQLQLQSLPAAQMEQLIAQLAHAPAKPELRREIMQRSDGVPLFAEELARSLSAEEDGAQSNKVPATLWDLLAARLDRLPPLAKHLAQGAALLGSGWEPALLQSLLDVPDAQLDQGLSQLQQEGLLQLSGQGHGQGIWQFRHALLRDAALETLAPAERRALHRRAAEALMGPFALRAAEAPEALARHLHAAQDPAAAHYWLQAAERAAAQSAQVEACHLFEQGLAALQWSSAADAMLAERLRPALLLGLGHCLLALQGYGSAAARHCYDQALQACQTNAERNRGLRFQALWGLWLGSRSGPGEAPALELAAQLRSVAAQEGDAAAAVQASYALGNNHFFAGQLAQACIELRAAAEAGQRLNPTLLTGRYGEHGGITARTLLSWPLALQGQAEAAQAQAREGLAQARALGHLQTLGFSLAIVAVLQRHLREVAAAETYARELAALGERHGMALWQAVGGLVLGWALAQGGDASGLPTIEAACAASAVAMPSTEATFLSFLIEAQLQLGQAQAALQRVDEALAKAQERQEFYLLPELWRMRALGLRLSQAEDAVVSASLDQALAHAEAFGAELLRQRCLSQRAAFQAAR